jgi:hypothetical protein
MTLSIIFMLCMLFSYTECCYTECCGAAMRGHIVRILVCVCVCVCVCVSERVCVYGCMHVRVCVLVREIYISLAKHQTTNLKKSLKHIQGHFEWKVL